MKLIHLSDLHIGKRVNEVSLLEDQAHILQQIVEIVQDERPDLVLIAGDVYDKPIPPAEAVTLFDDFLVTLSQQDTVIGIISGNHDSAQRLAFGARLIQRSGVYVSPVYNGTVTPLYLEDTYGKIAVYLLPFLKPVQVRACFPDEPIASYTDALACAIAHLPIDPAIRNVLVTHQFVTGAQRCDSEIQSVGGSDNVDSAVFAPFDYVALGHLHAPQNIRCTGSTDNTADTSNTSDTADTANTGDLHDTGNIGDTGALSDTDGLSASASRSSLVGQALSVDTPCIRYCGTPLKYSFSEVHHAKSVTVAELEQKGKCRLTLVPLQPKRDWVEIRGTYQEVTAASFYRSLDRYAYCRIILTDEQDIPEAIGKLRAVYPNLLRLDYDNRRTRHTAELSYTVPVEQIDPLDLFVSFYKAQNNSELSEDQRVYLTRQMERIWEDTP